MGMGTKEWMRGLDFNRLLKEGRWEGRGGEEGKREGGENGDNDDDEPIF